MTLLTPCARVLISHLADERSLPWMQGRREGGRDRGCEEEEEGVAAMGNSHDIFMHFSQTRKIIIKVI